MFRVEHNVPEVYINESRDFQLISRLYDLVFQQVRQSTDSMELITSTKECNDSLLPLLSTKVGFFSNNELPEDIYRKVLSAFPIINRYKGSLEALKLVIYLFEQIVNTDISYELKSDSAEIIFKTYCSYTDLLLDLLDYVRPCGYIINWHVEMSTGKLATDFIQTDNVTVNHYMLSSAGNKVVTRGSNNTSETNIGFTQIDRR